MPRKSLVQRGEKCKVGKLSKERLSVLLCFSAAGEKLRPSVIGNDARPSVFKEQHVDTKHLHVMWFSNKSASMSTAIYIYI